MIRNDLALRNANIMTMNSRQPQAEALAVRDGGFVAVGAWHEVAPYAEGISVLDLAGKTVLPGFIDSHVHLTWTGLKEVALDFESAETVDDVQAIMHQAAAEAPPGQLLFGMGLNQYRFPNRQLPTSADLDAVAPQHPTFIVGVTGHYSLANSRCLEGLNLSPGMPGVDPSGLLRDRANTLAERRMRARFTQEQGLDRLHRAAADRAISVGLTTVHALEGDDQPDDPTIQALLAVAPKLPLRLVVWYQTMDVAAVQKLGLRQIGGCILLDGDFGPHTAALLEPYADQPDHRGTLYYTQQEVDTFVETAHRAGLQIAMHAVGDRAAEQALNAYERALTIWPLADHRHRIEHFEIYDETLIGRARRLAVCLGIQPPFNAHFGGHTRLISILGEERASRSDPVRSLIEAGVHVGGGSDSTVTPMQPLYSVYCAVNHSNLAERIDVERALQLYTLDNAALAFEEEEKGSIQVNKLGDLTVLGADPRTVAPAAIADIPVEMTIVGGEVVYSR
ncbi:MAG: amidohydrolase [Anaerolineales bacterium]|nr:MAG: amidohydrolase [Anaerolineales bacterium]